MNDQLLALLKPLEPINTKFPERLSRLEGMEAIIFDIYGTLLISDSGDIGVNEPVDSDHAFRQAVEISGSKIADNFDGPGTLKELILEDHSVTRSKGISHPEVDILEIWTSLLNEGLSLDLPKEQIENVAFYYELLVNNVWPMPNLISTLSRIHESGIAMGIVSNAQFYTPVILNHFLDGELYKFFDKELCSYSFQNRAAKPSLEIFEPILRQLKSRDIRPENAVYVGNDMLNDVYTAQECGLKTIFFAGDQRSLRLREQDSRVAGRSADVVIGDLSRLFYILGI